MEFSPDGARLATGSFDRTARLWDARTGELLATLRGHAEEVVSLVYSPDGSRVATGSFDGTAKIWDARTGELLATLRGHNRALSDLIYSPDGRVLASASGDHTARLWDAETGALVTELTDRVGLRQPDGAITWPIPPAALTRVGCERLRAFDEAERAATRGLARRCSAVRTARPRDRAADSERARARASPAPPCARRPRAGA
ncbi:MAG: WD40 repeat domain-containing protein [Myxococcales bacterium]|nr:WD40 repeat domain-containing protein [Myxococcales bacterium]